MLNGPNAAMPDILSDAKGQYEKNLNSSKMGFFGLLKGGVAQVDKQHSVTLINQDLSSIDPKKGFDAGHWVLSLASEPQGNPAFINNAIAQISLGCGGVTIDFECNIGPGCSFQVPASTIKVIGKWDKQIFGATSETAFPDTKIYATINRGHSSGKPHRVFGIAPSEDSGSAEGPIPRFSRLVGVHQTGIEPSAYPADARLILTNGPFDVRAPLGGAISMATVVPNGFGMRVPDDYVTWKLEWDTTLVATRVWFQLDL